MAKLYRQDVLDYFLACEDLFWQSRVFRSQRDRWFWYQHSQGLSLREIQDKHTTVTGNYLSWVTIHKRLKPYRTMVGITAVEIAFKEADVGFNSIGGFRFRGVFLRLDLGFSFFFFAMSHCNTNFTRLQ